MQGLVSKSFPIDVVRMDGIDVHADPGREHGDAGLRGAVVLVFLVLAAQYESWSLPPAVILVWRVPAVFGGGRGAGGMDINIFTQIGLWCWWVWRVRTRYDVEFGEEAA